MDYKSNYDERKGNVLALIQKATTFYTKINDADKATSLSDIAYSVMNGKFSIIVVGQFSVGKSTFLNALMGEKYLPSFKAETTATINFLRSVKESPTGTPLIKINYSDGSVEQSDDVSLENIERYVSTHGDNVATKISSVEIFLDSEYLNDGVSLVDSPGLNGLLEGHEKITRDQINRSHAAIFAFSAHQPGSKSDFEKLKSLMDRCDSVLIILNQIDHIRKDEETVEDVVDKLKENFAQYFNTRELPEIYPISSLEALVARSSLNLEYKGKNNFSLSEKDELLKESRIEVFENRLIKYLTQGEKSQKELLSPVEKVRSFINETKATMASRIEELNITTDTDEVKNQINVLKDELDGLRNKLNSSRADIRNKVYNLQRDAEKQIKAEAAKTKADCLAQVTGTEDLEELEQNATIYLNRINNKFVDIWEDVRTETEKRYRNLIREEYYEYASSIEERLNSNDSNKDVELAQVKLDTSLFEIDVDIDDYLDRRAEILKDLDSDEDRLDELQIELINSKRDEKKRENFEKQKQLLRQNHSLDMQVLGERPKVEQIITYEEKRTKGLVGAIKWIFTGNPKKQVPKTVFDSSAQEEYDVRRQEMISAHQNDLEELEARLRAIPESNPEMIELQIKRIQRVNERHQGMLKELKDSYDEKVKKARRSQGRKAKAYLEDLIADIEKENLHKIYDMFKDSRERVTNAMLDVLELELRNVMNRKKEEIELREKQLTSSLEEKNALLEELNNNKAELTEILGEADACVAEIKNIPIDKIIIS